MSDINKRIAKEIAKVHWHNFIDTRERQGYHVWVCACGKIYAYGSISKYNNYGNPNYSENITDAVDVMEKMKDEGFVFQMIYKDGFCSCIFIKGKKSDDNLIYGEGNNRKISMAISQAALKTIDKK